MKNRPEITFRADSTWCERGDSNPHGVTTRTSNVLVYHSNTLANVLGYYNLIFAICQYFFCKTLAISRQL